MSFVKTREVRTTQDASRTDENKTPCHICRGMTFNAILSDHGGMCYPCFKRYCEGTPQNRIGLKTNLSI